MKSSKVYKQKEIALANCANLTTHCGTKQALDLDGGKVDITVGKAGVKLTKLDACSYIATSKCKAPTVDIGAVDSKNVGLQDSIYNIIYLEYSKLSVAEAVTDLTLDVDVYGKIEKSDQLGGTLFDLAWKKSDETTDFIPAEFFV